MTVGKPRTFLFLDLPLPSSPLLVGKRLNLANCTINSNISASLFCSLAAIGFAFMFMQSKILYCALKRVTTVGGTQASVLCFCCSTFLPTLEFCHATNSSFISVTKMKLRLVTYSQACELLVQSILLHYTTTGTLPTTVLCVYWLHGHGGYLGMGS